MKNSFLPFIYSLLLTGTTSAQDAESESKQFTFHLGAQTRITPIYPKGYPVFIDVTDRNIWEQPDMHLSGPSVFYKVEGKISDSRSISFSQAIRYDFLYQTFRFNTQPFNGVGSVDKRAAVTDFYLDGESRIPLRNSYVKVGAGLALCGVGSGYLLTQRFVDNNGESVYITSKENFVFPAVTGSFGWQKNRFEATLKMGYA